MNVLITGAYGFVGKNLQVHLSEHGDISIKTFTRHDQIASLPDMLADVEFVVHLAGVNRPKDISEFAEGNADLTESLCDAIAETGRKIPVIYSSSTQAALDNPYGQSKLAAEQSLLDFSAKTGSPVYLYRLPNVFGKWCKPNYNSAVATFCYNISQGESIQINDPTAVVNLVYVDDVVKQIIALLDGAVNTAGYCEISPVYRTTVGELAGKIEAYRYSRKTLVTEPVGTGFDRALYSTYMSYLKPEQFAYDLVKHEDPRGVFVEMLRTRDSGQFSFFTAHPGITRGGHYHHTKTEKFLVIKGQALFKFRHVVTNECYEVSTHGGHPRIVETVPGWTHDITNVGDSEMVVLLWANELFDRENPDTYAKPL